jgi:hypothetical protein
VVHPIQCLYVKVMPLEIHMDWHIQSNPNKEEQPWSTAQMLLEHHKAQGKKLVSTRLWYLSGTILALTLY